MLSEQVDSVPFVHLINRFVGGYMDTARRLRTTSFYVHAVDLCLGRTIWVVEYWIVPGDGRIG